MLSALEDGRAASEPLDHPHRSRIVPAISTYTFAPQSARIEMNIPDFKLALEINNAPYTDPQAARAHTLKQIKNPNFEARTKRSCDRRDSHSHAFDGLNTES
jgi:hypothetical protein